MKKALTLLALAAGSLSLAATPAPTTLTKGTLKIGMEGTYPPFT